MPQISFAAIYIQQTLEKNYILMSNIIFINFSIYQDAVIVFQKYEIKPQTSTPSCPCGDVNVLWPSPVKLPLQYSTLRTVFHYSSCNFTLIEQKQDNNHHQSHRLITEETELQHSIFGNPKEKTFLSDKFICTVLNRETTP